jgi:hypothetical protein
MASNSRKLGRLLGTDTKIGIEDVDATIPVGVQFYDNDAALPADGGVVGAKAYTVSEAKFYFWNGDVWGPLDIAEWEAPPSFSHVQGNNYGYFAGGQFGYGDPPQKGVNKIPFASDGNAVVCQALRTTTVLGEQKYSSGATSDTHGFIASGENNRTRLVKWAIVSENSAAATGATMGLTIWQSVGQSSTVAGYVSGGRNLSYARSYIQKYPFAISTGTTNIVGNLTVSRLHEAGVSSVTHGYTAGGSTLAGSGTSSNVIDKFPFASDGNATDVGDLDRTAWRSAGMSSFTDGYIDIGYTINSPEGAINRFSFASDANAVFQQNAIKYGGPKAGTQSRTHGYLAGSNGGTQEIDKISFVSVSGTTRVGNLVAGLYGGTGHQY